MKKYKIYRTNIRGRWVFYTETRSLWTAVKYRARGCYIEVRNA